MGKQGTIPYAACIMLILNSESFERVAMKKFAHASLGNSGVG